MIRTYRSILNSSLPRLVKRVVQRAGIFTFSRFFKERHNRLQAYVIRPRNGKPMVLHLDWQDYTDAGYLVYESWEPANTAFFLKILMPGDVVIDGGANIGYFSFLAAVSCNARAIAIEPMTRNRASIERSIEKNSGAVLLVPKALGERKEEVSLTYRYLNSGSGTIYGDFGATDPVDAAYIFSETVETTTLDDLVAEHALTQVSVVKLDIQGGEIAALKGATRILKEGVVKHFLVEYTSSQGDVVREYLKQWRYHPHRITAEGTIVALSEDEPLIHKQDYVYTQ